VLQGRGLFAGDVVEISGKSGSAKTGVCEAGALFPCPFDPPFCLHAIWKQVLVHSAISCVMPQALGGHGKPVVYFDNGTARSGCANPRLTVRLLPQTFGWT
jgi:hypothetical protein